MRTLTQNLADRHRLVQEVEEIHVDGHYLTRYRFAHALFQEALYTALGSGERRLLHGEIAMALESRYGDQARDIAVTLAHHYRQAGHTNKEIEFTVLAGEQAQAAYANDEADGYYLRALVLLGTETVGETGKDRRYRALHELGKVYFHIGRIIEAEKLLREALELGKALNVAAKSWRDFITGLLKYLWRKIVGMRLSIRDRKE